eukprot:m.3564 g.3564  ORF g.3564 m.3564 type:complete len:679 (+) comp9556_c0_seq1:52-2088(+)
MGNQSTSNARIAEATTEHSSAKPSQYSGPRFDPKSVVGNLLLSSDGRTVTRDGSKRELAYVTLDRVLEKGSIYQWKLKIEDDSGASACCGVADHPVEEFDDIFTSKRLRVCRSFSGQLYDRGRLLAETAVPYWMSGSVVTFVADLTLGTVSFGVESDQLSVIFTNVSGPIVPIVTFYAGFSKKITIIDFTLLKESPPSRAVGRVRTPKEVLKACTRPVNVNFDPDSPEGAIGLSDDRKTLTRTDRMRGNAFCLFNRNISCGAAFWKFQVHSDTGASTVIGVAEEGARMPSNNTSVFYSPQMYLWRSYEGRIYEKGNELADRLTVFDWANECSTVGVLLDMDARTMWFTCDGQILPVSVSGFSGSVRPVVGFYAGMTKCVSIVEYFESDDTAAASSASSVAATVASYEQPINFHNSVLVGRLQVINDGTTLFREPGGLENSYCVANIPLISGIYEWTLVVEQDTGASTCLGVAERPIDLSSDQKNIYESPSVWVCRSYGGQLYARGVELTTVLCPLWHVGSVVKLTFNADFGTLAFSVNEREFGVAFRDVTRPVYPFFAFYAMMEKRLSLLHFSHEPTKIKSGALNDLSQPENRRPRSESNHEKSVPKTKGSFSGDGTARPAVSRRTARCLVCGRERADVALQPCKHAVVCWECAKELSENCSDCPQCGIPVEGFLNII